MLAHRVVLHRGLEMEPEQWLASVDETDFQNWEAYYQCEPFGNEQALLAKVINQLSMLVAMKVGGDEGKDLIIETQDMLPGDWVWRQERGDSLAEVQRKLEGGG